VVYLICYFPLTGLPPFPKEFSQWKPRYNTIVPPVICISEILKPKVENTNTVLNMYSLKEYIHN
jgi:hypothetical protein